MFTLPRRLIAAASLVTGFAPLLHAHPGHDDGHELTWDFSHLVQHPAATLLCASALAIGVGTVVCLFRRQSFRGSQASRAK